MTGRTPVVMPAPVPRARLPRRAGMSRTVVLAAYGALFGYLVISGRVTDVVSPRVVPAAWGAFALLVLFALASARRVGSPHGGASITVLTLFLAPLALAPVALAGDGTVLARGATISLYAGAEPVSLATPVPSVPPPGAIPAAPATARIAPAGQEVAAPAAAPEAGGAPAAVDANSPVPAHGTITLNRDNYGRIYNALYNHPERYVGRTIHVTGFVSRGTLASSDRNDFIVSRELMWCCAADAVTIGFVSKVAGASSLARYSWVSVTGVLGTTEYTDDLSGVSATVPSITVTKLEHLSQYDFTFVYPEQ